MGAVTCRVKGHVWKIVEGFRVCTKCGKTK